MCKDISRGLQESLVPFCNHIGRDDMKRTSMISLLPDHPKEQSRSTEYCEEILYWIADKMLAISDEEFQEALRNNDKMHSKWDVSTCGTLVRMGFISFSMDTDEVIVTLKQKAKDFLKERSWRN